MCSIFSSRVYQQCWCYVMYCVVSELAAILVRVVPTITPISLISFCTIRCNPVTSSVLLWRLLTDLQVSYFRQSGGLFLFPLYQHHSMWVIFNMPESCKGFRRNFNEVWNQILHCQSWYVTRACHNNYENVHGLSVQRLWCQYVN